jgi:transposase
VAPRSEHCLVERAQVILRAAASEATRAIAAALGVRPATLSKWRTRFAPAGVAGLQDAARPGRPRK